MTDDEYDSVRVARASDGDGAELLDDQRGDHLRLDGRGIVHDGRAENATLSEFED